jgi:hypothetical protein
VIRFTIPNPLSMWRTDKLLSQASSIRRLRKNATVTGKRASRRVSQLKAGALQDERHSSMNFCVPGATAQNRPARRWDDTLVKVRR